MKKTRAFWFLLLLVAAGCNGRGEKVTEGSIRMQTVCPLEENLTLVGRPVSLDVASDGSFLVSDGTNVVGYDPSGHQTFAWNKKGRGPYEYFDCGSARAFGDTVYVWDMGSARLIAYDRDGNGLWSYDYESAICDFQPAGSSVFFYNAGRKWESVVTELDVKTMTPVRSCGASSFAHKAMQSLATAVPLAFRDGALYFMSKDKMDLYRMTPGASEEASLVKQFTSDSFRCKELEERLSAANDLFAFIFQNSAVIAFSFDGTSYGILTAEGTAHLAGMQGRKLDIDQDERVYRLYRFDRKARIVSVSVGERNFDASLVSVRDGVFYLLREDPEQGTYRLVTLE